MPAGKHKPPAGAGYSGEPHIFVSADTRQKASFVKGVTYMFNYQLPTTNNLVAKLAHFVIVSKYLRAYKAPVNCLLSTGNLFVNNYLRTYGEKMCLHYPTTSENQRRQSVNSNIGLVNAK